MNGNVNIEVYNEALDFAFSSHDVRNIAISGAYGAGKSSVMASYEKQHKDKNFMHISLAHFEDESESDSNEKAQESILEGKILNQLIHQIPPNNIPQKNFKIKQNVSKKQIAGITVLFLLLAIFTLFFLLHERWSAFVYSFSGCFEAILKISLSPFAQLVVGMSLIGLVYFFVYQLIKLKKKQKAFQTS